MKKEITLPSGARIVIKKLNSFCEAFTTRKQTDEERQDASLRKMLANPENGPLMFEGKPLRIVDKPTAGDGEIRIEELEQADVNTLCQEIISFSGLDKAGAEARKTFPEGQAPGGAAPSNIEDLPLSANGASQAATG